MKRKYLLIVMTVLALAISGCGKEADDDEVIGSVAESTQSVEESKETEESKTEESTEAESSVESSSVEESSVAPESQPVENKVKTLEDYYNQPLQKLNLDSAMKMQKQANSETFSDMGYEVKGNVYTNWFQYAIDVDAEYAAKAFDLSFTAELLNPLLDGIAKESGVEDVTLQYIYKDKDGNEIYNKCFVRGQIVDVIPSIEEVETTVEADSTEEVESSEANDPTEEDDDTTDAFLNANTLEDIYSIPEMADSLKTQVASLKESMASVYKDIDIIVKGNTMTYKYQYAVPITNPNVEEALSESIAPTAAGLVKNFKTLIGADDIAVQYIFIDMDGNEIFNKTYTE